jgi:hypothetical protein
MAAKINMKYYPKIKFIINKSFDKRPFDHFGPYIKMALPRELGFVLNKNFSFREKEKMLSAFAEHCYQINKKKIQESLKKTNKNWLKVAKFFYQKVDQLFHDWPWPRGNYRGYPTVWWMYPRFIKLKMFAFPWQNSYVRANGVIAHEMLHFITYDYLQKKYKIKPSESGSKNNTVWQFTENLNVLIENEKYWHVFTPGSKSQPYDDCKKVYQKMQKIWQKNKSIDKLITRILL